jgi:hypothetical protein
MKLGEPMELVGKERDTVGEILEKIRQERHRQILKKGYGHEHDDRHSSGELVLLAAIYALSTYGCGDYAKEAREELYAYFGEYVEVEGHTNPPKVLIKAAALLVAEIERWERLPDRCPSAVLHEQMYGKGD